jgi:transposase InsO family protein
MSDRDDGHRPEGLVARGADDAAGTPPLAARRKGRALSRPEPERPSLTAEQRLLILDSWMRSKLSAPDFAPLVGLSPHTLYAWKKRFESAGPAGLEGRARGPRPGSRLPETTQRAILLLKQAHPEWGCERLHDVLLRSAGYGASPSAIARFLHGQGYERVAEPSGSHPPKVTRFERARANQLWQSDLFTFVLRRENRRVHLVVFLDDHSRFVTGYGLHATASGALVREVLSAAIASFGAPEEVLTDHGPQYDTWRGKSAFTRLLERRGIRHLLARPRHPQTLGKVERFWGSLWRECLETAVFRGLDDARTRIGLFIDHYNFHRPHQGIEGLVPADRYFAAAPEVRATLAARVAAQALELARDGLPRKSFYLTGRIGDEAIALHAEGSRVVLTKADGRREEVDLSAEGRRALPDRPAAPTDWPVPVTACGRLDALPGSEEEDAEPAPGCSALDAGLAAMGRDRGEDDDGDETDETEAADRWQPAGAPAGGDDPRDALGGDRSERGEHAAGDLAHPLLPTRDAGDPWAGGGARGAAEEGSHGEPGEPDRAAHARSAAARAGAPAQPGAAAGGPADDRAERTEDDAEAAAQDPAGAAGDPAAAGDGADRR